jgi:hypothetical protein
MDSFIINLKLSNTNQEVLVIPEECTDKSVFHLVTNGRELCKLLYTDKGCWELMENTRLKPEEVEELGKKIEEHYF